MILGMVGGLFAGRGLLGNPAQSAADSRQSDSSAWTNPLGHNQRWIVLQQEARADYLLGGAFVIAGFILQCLSWAFPSLSPNGWLGWLVTFLIPAALALAGRILRPRIIANAFERIALAQDWEITYLSGNKPFKPSEPRVQEMRVLIHRAVHDKRLRCLLQKRWQLAEIESRTYSNVA